MPNQRHEEELVQLRRQLAERDPEVRRLAATVLAEFGEPQWQDWLKGDPKDFRRLAESADPAAVDVLIQAVALGHWETSSKVDGDLGAETAATLLADIGATGAVDVLIRQLQNPRPAVVCSCISALGRLREERAIDPLIDLLKTTDEVLFERFDYSLAPVVFLRKDQVIAPGMVAQIGRQIAVQRAADNVRACVVKALQQFDDPRATTAIVLFREYGSDFARQVARARLRKLIGCLLTLSGVAFGIGMVGMVVTPLPDLSRQEALPGAFFGFYLFAMPLIGAGVMLIRKGHPAAAHRKTDVRKVLGWILLWLGVGFALIMVGMVMDPLPETSRQNALLTALFGFCLFALPLICGGAVLILKAPKNDDPCLDHSPVAVSSGRHVPDGHMEVPRPVGDGACSDDDCPCGQPGAVIPHGQGYLYISEEVVAFREDCPSLTQAMVKLEKLRSEAGSVVFANAGVFTPILLCALGAKKRGIDLDIASSDAKSWWETGMAPLRPTPLAKGTPDDQTTVAAPKTEEPARTIFRCPQCGKRLRVASNRAGKPAKCPGCAKVVIPPK